ncbi:SGNH/GDSL hydrolase family protein [Thermogemmatispora sp.]|uniref:SGNH/GDSL hydrolase family protein n=1 Tax=Thermogemmatispora sp. TaxID=1968838 RepID=UPI0035E42716
MGKRIPACCRLVLPFVLTVLLLFVLAPDVRAAHAQGLKLVGPKKYYLVLGNSLAFGFQPDLDFAHGYSNYFFQDLKAHGTTSMVNLACPGETSVTFLNGKCPFPFLRKYPYLGSQLNAALNFLRAHAGQVSPVTLDIGANDVLPYLNSQTCAIDTTASTSALQTLDYNLRQVILPQLRAALTVNGQVTGDLLVMNYYDPYQNKCPNTVPYTQQLNEHLASDVQGFGVLVDVFSAFGGATVPNNNICSYTWMCSVFHDIHATDKGYQVIAQSFEQTVGY